MIALSLALVFLLVGFVLLAAGLLIEPLLVFVALVPLAGGVYQSFAHHWAMGVMYIGVAAPSWAWAVRALDRIHRPTPPGANDPGPSRQAERDHPLVGRSGRSLTPLRPAGYVEFEGRRYDGIAEGGEGLIPAGATVRAIGVRGGQVLVRAAHRPSGSEP